MSYMRPAVQRTINGDVLYAEIGWIKSGANPTPTVYWTVRDANLQIRDGYGPSPGCCSGYNYQVVSTGNGNWSLYFNDLNTPFVTQWTGFDVADDWFSGGEVSSSQNAMGVSGNWNVAWRSGGTWYNGCGKQLFIEDAIYHVIDINSCYSWQVYGNN